VPATSSCWPPPRRTCDDGKALDADDDDRADQGDLKKRRGRIRARSRMDQALESQWIAGAGQLGAELFNGIGRSRLTASVYGPHPTLLALRFLATRYDCSRISGLCLTSISRGRATMAIRAPAPSLLSRLCAHGHLQAIPRRFDLFAILRGARNRGDVLLDQSGRTGSGSHMLRFIVGSVAQHRPGDPRHLVGEGGRRHVRVRSLGQGQHPAA